MKMRTMIIIGCLVLCIASLGGCRYGEVGQEGKSGACDYVAKDADSFVRDFRNYMDCYVNEVREVFLTTRTWRATSSQRAVGSTY